MAKPSLLPLQRAPFCTLSFQLRTVECIIKYAVCAIYPDGGKRRGERIVVALDKLHLSAAGKKLLQSPSFKHFTYPLCFRSPRYFSLLMPGMSIRQGCTSELTPLLLPQSFSHSLLHFPSPQRHLRVNAHFLFVFLNQQPCRMVLSYVNTTTDAILYPLLPFHVPSFLCFPLQMFFHFVFSICEYFSIAKARSATGATTGGHRWCPLMQLTGLPQ